MNHIATVTKDTEHPLEPDGDGYTYPYRLDLGDGFLSHFVSAQSVHDWLVRHFPGQTVFWNVQRPAKPLTKSEWAIIESTDPTTTP